MNDNLNEGAEGSEGTVFLGEEKDNRASKNSASRAKVSGLRADDNAVETKTMETLHKQPVKRIVIDSTETQKEDVHVAVNGHTYCIQRDKEVELPLAVIEVLDNAKTTVYKQVKRENGEGYDLVPSEVRRFPYRTA